MSLFQKAERKKARLRLGLCGPSGAGKTMSALRLMAGLLDPPYDGKIAVIDTEHASASLYADVIPFDTLIFEPPYDVVRLIAAIHAAEEAGYQGLILDSITHFWASEGGLLELPPNLEEVNLCKILHKLTLSALLGLPANWPGVAGNSGQLTGI